MKQIITIIAVIFLSACNKIPYQSHYVFVKDTIHITIIDTIYVYHYKDTIVDIIHVLPGTKSIMHVNKIYLKPNYETYYSRFSKLGISIGGNSKRRKISNLTIGLQYGITFPRLKPRKLKHFEHF